MRNWISQLLTELKVYLAMHLVSFRIQRPSPQELLEQFRFDRKHRLEWQQFFDLILVEKGLLCGD
jgi:hypothetical protein